LARRVILLSGPIGSGKSTLGLLLESHHKANLFKTNRLISALMPKVAMERTALQQAGELLDRRTKGDWVANALARLVQTIDENAVVVRGGPSCLDSMFHFLSGASR